MRSVSFLLICIFSVALSTTISERVVYLEQQVDELERAQTISAVDESDVKEKCIYFFLRKKAPATCKKILSCSSYLSIKKSCVGLGKKVVCKLPGNANCE